MGRRCCGGASCGCALNPGSGVEITGSGLETDPFVISADVNLDVTDNTTFDLSLIGEGSVANPYVLEVDFAGTSSIRSLGDVADGTPTNGQVLVWNSTLQRYEPGSPTPAASGSVSHDLSLDGDGSPGSPLQVLADSARYLYTDTDGVGMTDAGINRLVRRFSNSTARNASLPSPELNTYSTLDTVPGKIDYWDGTSWKPLDNIPVFSGDEFLELSGSYTAGGRVSRLVQRVTTTTEADGTFVALSSTALTGLAGVLSVTIQEVGAVPFKAMLAASGGQVVGTAYRLDTGAMYPLQPIDAIVEAIVYA